MLATQRNFFFSDSAPGFEPDEVLPSCPGGGVATYRCHHQSRDSSALRGGNDGGDEDEDRPDGVVEELLEQQNSGHTTAHQPITVIYEDPPDGADATAGGLTVSGQLMQLILSCSRNRCMKRKTSRTTRNHSATNSKNWNAAHLGQP